MKIEYNQMKFIIYDIETLKEFFLFLCYSIEENKYYEFRINKNTNDLFKLLNFIEKNESFFVGYNNIKFDSQVIQYIYMNYEQWQDLSNLEICNKISLFSSKVIDDINNDLFPPYRETEIFFKNIDLMKIHHYDNENKRTSLKWLEYSMDLENIEEMPIHHNKKDLTDEEIDTIVSYCYNDVIATTKLFKFTIGETNHPLYQGKNKIEQRVDFINEYDANLAALNFSDVKIGDEINLMSYMALTKKTKKEIYEIKKQRKPTKHFLFGDAVPDYVKFKTKDFRDFFESVRKVRVNLTAKQFFPFSYNKTNYIIAKGGIHSVDPKRIILPSNNEILMDADIGSQYPNAINKRKLYPSHLGVQWLNGYSGSIRKRLEYKKKGKQNRKYLGVSELLKLALNGGGFGKTNEVNSWQYDPRVTYFCTIGNQFEILMLIEQLEINGIHCISANTDGIVCLFNKNKENDYYKICKDWEFIVGNNEMGNLEYKQYKKLIQNSVNDYIAVDVNNDVKKKGDFTTDFELHKNKSRRIIPLALEAYFINNINPEEFIKSHKNIFDFCIGEKSNKNYHYEFIKNNGETIKYNRTIRYIVTKEGGKLLKVKNDNCFTDGAKISNLEAPDKISGKVYYCSIFNKIDLSWPIEEYNIDYDYYIKKVKDNINLLQYNNKSYNTNQMSLF